MFINEYERAGWNEKDGQRDEFHLYLSYGTRTFRIQPARGYQILSARIRVPSPDTITLENILRRSNPDPLLLILKLQ